MGLLDIFARKGPGAIKKHAARVANKRSQNVDRWDSIQALGQMAQQANSEKLSTHDKEQVERRAAEAVAALLKRFDFKIDPSITDQEEKDSAFRNVVAAGDVAIGPVRDFLYRSDAISWPLKMLEELMSKEDVVSELLELLASMDTEYERDPEKKIQLIAYLEDRQDERILDAVRPFLDDMNETARFHAVGAVYAQANAEGAKDDLLEELRKEESVRVRVRILDGFIEKGWPIPEDAREDIRPQLPQGFALDSDGNVKKS